MERAAPGEKTKAKPGMVASKRLAVTYIMTCERSTPSTRPTTRAATPTASVSMTMMAATWARPMPSVR